MALAAEEVPCLEACRGLCEACTTGMDRGELVELLLRLSEGKAGLEQMLDELSDQQQGLRDESARIHKEIKELHEGYLSPGAAAAEWQFFQRPRVLGQLWEQAKALPSAESMAKGVAPANLGKQLAEQWSLFGQQAASQLGSTLFRREEPPSPKAGSLLVRLVLDEAYRQAAQRQEAEQEEAELWPSDEGLESPVEEEASSESSGSRSRAEELYQKTGCKLWSVPSQWQDFGKLFSKTFYSRPEAKRAAASAPAEPRLGRLVLDDVYRKVAAQGAAREQRLLGDQGAASALRAVTLHWQHFGAPGRGVFKEAERKAPTPVPGPLHLSGLWGALEQSRGESEESEESDTDERDSPTSAGSSVLQSPRALGQQLLGSWQSWGKKVNEQLSDYVSQGSVGWQSLKQAANGAFAEPDLQKAKRKAKRRAKREAMREAENDPDAPAFSRVLLEVSVRLGDGSIAPLEVSTNEHCREAASRFARQHGLPSALRRGLRAHLRQAVRTATSLPARLEVDLAEVQCLAP